MKSSGAKKRGLNGAVLCMCRCLDPAASGQRSLSEKNQVASDKQSGATVRPFRRNVSTVISSGTIAVLHMVLGTELRGKSPQNTQFYLVF